MDNRIGELRREHGLTLKQLGKILNVRDNALSQYETGKRNPQLGLLQEIANYFQVSIEYLTKDTDRRDYTLDNDEDSLKLLKLIDENEITHLNLSKSTSLQLALWITVHWNVLNKPKNKYLLNTAYFFVKDILSENKILDHFSKERIEENEAFNKIEHLLIFDENYYGAGAKEVLEFMQQSDRIGVEKTANIISLMKKSPTYNPEEPKN